MSVILLCLYESTTCNNISQTARRDGKIPFTIYQIIGHILDIMDTYAGAGRIKFFYSIVYCGLIFSRTFQIKGEVRFVLLFVLNDEKVAVCSSTEI